MKLENTRRLTQPVQILLIILISLGIYYPAIFAEPLSTDDHLLITRLINTQDIHFKALFFPDHPGVYFRPFLYLTFLIDGKLWGGLESFMHLENIIIHTASAVTIFFIALASINFFKIKTTYYFPFFVSLVFALHPINTESVNWISGRTDLLAGLFVFLSLLILFTKKNRLFWIIFSASLYLLGLLSKEVAIGVLIIVFLLSFLRGNDNIYYTETNRLFIIFVFLLTTLVYAVMRTDFSFLHDMESKLVTSNATGQPQTVYFALKGILKATGFYMKKLFVPVPLNLAIISISTHVYLPLGIVVAAMALLFSILIIFNIRLNNHTRFLIFWYLFAVIFFMPAVPLAATKMTWTPIAERYIYLSSLASAMILTFIVDRTVRERNFVVIMTIILLICSLITYKRTIIWQKNITLWADTVKKSPDFAPARNDYAIALWRAGKLKEAKEQFVIAKNLAKIKNSAIPEINLALLDSAEENTIEGINNLRKLIRSSKKIDKKNKIHLLKKLSSLIESKIIKNKTQHRRIYKELLSYYEELYKLTHNGFYAYRSAQLHLFLGNKKSALAGFRQALRLSPNEYFSPAARKLVKKLEAELADKAGES